MQIKAHDESNWFQIFSHEIKGIIIRNTHVKMKAQPVMVQKLWPRLNLGVANRLLLLMDT